MSSSLVKLPQWLPPMSMSPRQVQLIFCLFGRLLQNHQVSLSLIPSKLLPLSGVWITWDFCMSSLRRESQFPTAVQLLCMQVLLILKGRHSGGSFSWCRTLRLGTLMWGSEPCSLRRTSVIVVFISFVAYPADIVGWIFFFFTLFYFTILYWFCHTLTWIRHECTWVPNHEPPSHLPPHIISLDHPRAPAPSILYPVLNTDWQFVSYMIVYMLQCHSPKSSHPLHLPHSPKVCSIHLCLFCYLAYRVIVTIFLNSIYMC